MPLKSSGLRKLNKACFILLLTGCGIPVHLWVFSTSPISLHSTRQGESHYMAQFPQALCLSSLFISPSDSSSVCQLCRRHHQAGGDGSSLRAITNPLCFYYWWEALEVFIAPSLLYWRDEQTDTFTGGERASRRPKLPQHIYQQMKPRRTETASLTTASTEQQMFANKMY